MKELQIGFVLQCFRHTESNAQGDCPRRVSVSPCRDGQPLQQLWLQQVHGGAHHNCVKMVIVFADQEPALPGDVQLYGEAHLGSEAGHAVLGPKRWPADTSREHWWICSCWFSMSKAGSFCSIRPPDTISWNIITNDKKWLRLHSKNIQILTAE